MPELPEVEVILHQLRERVLGSTIKEIQLYREDMIQAGRSALPWYAGARIDTITRRGKSLVFTCLKHNQPRYLLAQLGMTGLFLFHPSHVRHAKHLHLKLNLDQALESTLYYWNPRRFGRIHLFNADQLGIFCRRRFGPDAYTIGQDEFYTLVKNSRGRIKALLLNQHALAGIGNIYANEILFRAGIHPYAKGNGLRKTTICGLYHAMRSILKEAIEWGGSTIQDFHHPNGLRGRYQERHAVYHKDGTPCPHGCSTSITRLTDERSSFICETCQKPR